MQHNFAQPVMKGVQDIKEMKEIVSSVSSKGQVTVPAEVRQRLGIKRGDKLSFVIEDEGGVRLQASRYQDLASLRGAAGSLKQSLSWEDMRRTAREDHIEDHLGEQV
jgi:antitoxin PrlF